MTLAGLTGLGGGQSVTSVASKVDQAVESFSISTSGAVQSFTQSRPEGGYYQFFVWTDPGSFSVPSGTREVDLFVLGGGGAGAPSTPGNGNVIDNSTVNNRNAETWKVGGGGGGGGYNQVVNYTVSEPPGTETKDYVVEVGAGGIWAISENAGRSGSSRGGGRPSFIYISIDGSEPGTPILSATGGDGGSPSPVSFPPNNRGNAGAGVAIINGSPSPVGPGNAERGNDNISVYPDSFSPTGYFCPSNIPSSELNENVHGYVTGSAGGAAGRKSPTGVEFPGNALRTAPRPDRFPTNGGDPDVYQYEGESQGADGFEVDSTIFGGLTGIGMPGGYGPGRWAAGGGGGINTRPPSHGGYGGGFAGGGGSGGGGQGGVVFPNSTDVSGSNATSYGSGGGGGSVLRAYNWPAPASQQWSLGGDGGSGYKGICIMRYIKSLY